MKTFMFLILLASTFAHAEGQCQRAYNCQAYCSGYYEYAGSMIYDERIVITEGSSKLNAYNQLRAACSKISKGYSLYQVDVDGRSSTYPPNLESCR